MVRFPELYGLRWNMSRKDIKESYNLFLFSRERWAILTEFVTEICLVCSVKTGGYGESQPCWAVLSCTSLFFLLLSFLYSLILNIPPSPSCIWNTLIPVCLSRTWRFINFFSQIWSLVFSHSFLSRLQKTQSTQPFHVSRTVVLLGFQRSHPFVIFLKSGSPNETRYHEQPAGFIWLCLVFQ